MVAHKNFYETTKEASIRLQNTVVMYKGEPYYVLALSAYNEAGDDIVRIYMEPIGHPQGTVHDRLGNFPGGYPDPDLGKYINDWMKKNPDAGVIRKQMNSPHFEKFRPFPLGMCNSQGQCYYTERQPQRSTQQGLTQAMVYQSPICFEPNKARFNHVTYYSPDFRATIMGEYPSLNECLSNLLSGKMANDAIGFHRDFALVKGPVGTIFLAYKSDIVGFLPHSDTQKVRIDEKFKHVIEATQDLRAFASVAIA